VNATAIALAGNDAGIIESFVRHHAALVDLLVVVDRASCDGTRAILEALRQEGLPLLIVDDPAPAGLETAKLSTLYRMVVTVFGPELVYLLEVGQSIRGADRATLEAELAHLPPGACGVLARPSAAPAGAAATSEQGGSEGIHAILRRDPADDDRLVIESFGRALRRADGIPARPAAPEPATPATARAPATGHRMDIAPVIDLCAGLQAERAIVMALPDWSRSIAQACPALALHVPHAGEPDRPVDLVFVPDMPAGFDAELSALANPREIRRLAYWPAQPRAAGALREELERWHRAGWEPDLMRTMTFRALSTYAASRHAALVLGPADAQRPDRSAAIRAALVAVEAAPHAWTDPAPSLIVHPLQSVELEPAAAAPSPAAAAAA
jgi:hypothetical protein